MDEGIFFPRLATVKAFDAGFGEDLLYQGYAEPANTRTFQRGAADVQAEHSSA